jgi:trimethylamine--corrinoid protein Co-methyltransferase
MDMRTMTACFSSPEAILADVATSNAANRLYGMQAWPVMAYTDCKRPGIQAAFSKMFGLQAASFCHYWGMGNDGLLSAGQDYSPVQHILDYDMSKAVARFTAHFDVTDETLATDLVLEMMGKTNTNFLDTEHTTAHYKSEQWYPKWLDRTSWQGTEAELKSEDEMLRRIDAYCKDAVRRYEPPAIDRAKIRELERIYCGAEKRLLK